ncbi:hypothetical protein FCL47_15375 [Desulfopila sp. IMCC35006]|uniref:alpha/beta hydrolase n=1 Tax=Desulfopila sp. IMCC35006 TaxID=2569542 RepID=UPI0010AC9259|nr:alpha/beta hydrolase [Desulfopila sp. IMCC35006]TKB25027.1 hypothetical protein FCL47_15375 [Desulfopila sp. IMCC35006]
MSAAEDKCCKDWGRFLWSEYYQEFPYFTEEAVRPGCHPCRLLHEKPAAKAIVLVHGLTDSPYYMRSIAEYFYEMLGYDVYLPLLQGHGLRHPDNMAGVSLEEWKKNVLFAIRFAAERAAQVSVGGLSTGGALSFYFGCTEPQVTGDIYLFSVAFGLYGGGYNIFSGILESLLSNSCFRLLDNGKPLVGSHPYRYDRVPLKSAGELVRLIREIDALHQTAADRSGAKRIFSAWSEHDRVINVKEIERVRNVTGTNQFISFVIPDAVRVDHACLVLKEPIYPVDSQPGEAPLEAANPCFAEMMAALQRFESAGC